MQRLRYLYILVLALLGLGGQASAQRVSIQTHLDRSEIRIGERAAIEMTIRTDNLAATRFHLVEDSTGTEALPHPGVRRTRYDQCQWDIQEIKARMIITSFDSTLITIPPIVVETPRGVPSPSPLPSTSSHPRLTSSIPIASSPSKIRGTSPTRCGISL